MKRWRPSEIEAERSSAGQPYLEVLRQPSMSVGLYTLAAGAVDRQSPHTEDEVYVVLAGRSQFSSGGETVEAEAGDTLFVPAHEEHRFHDITEELRLIVVFAPAEDSLGDS